ncbi:MAG: cold shock domain-containing protein [Leptolyngbyaceae cyanobacterium]
MVRRLIKHFLRWSRQILAKFKGAKSRHHAPIKRPLPPAPLSNQPETSRSAFPQTSQSTANRLSQSAISQEKNQYPPNPAANRAINPSNFKVSLSDYRYSPSSAVQSLSHQLLAPDAHSTNDQHQSATENIPGRRKEPDGKQSNETAKNNRNLELKLPPTIADTRQERVIKNRQPSQPTPLSLPVETQRSEQTNHASTPQKTAPAARSNNIIVKQGIIKLLFKLKKNNHHGYVAPDDGSKDIIFHQKYIGDEVFCQLERGMTVEVTAHITEGKAYADRIQIL